MPWGDEIQTAQQLLRQQKPAEAWAELSPLLERQPNNIDYLLLGGRIQLALDRTQAARKLFERAIGLNPKQQSAQFLLGFCLYVDNDFSPAVQALETARKLDPGHGPTVLYLALTLEGLARTEAALELYPQAVKMNRGAEAPLAFARLLFVLKRYGAAQPQVSEALRREPQSREAHYEQARLQYERGEYAQAVASAELALKLDGLPQTKRSLHFLLSRAFHQLKDENSAAMHRAAFESMPARLVR